MSDITYSFKNITGYDIQKYFEDFLLFVNEGQQSIASYFSGNSNTYPIDSFAELDRLNVEANKLQILFTESKSRFITSDFWDLMVNFDDSVIKLETISQFSKWYKAPLSKTGLNGGIELTYILKQNQSLENLANEIGYSDPENDWVDMALSNSLREEDYNLSGGVIFKFSYQNDFKFNLETVIDNISGINVYGKDIDKKIQFENNDIKVLPPKETMEQTVNILIGLIKGDVPEFPNDGIDKSLISKLNKSFNVFPSLFRQIYNTFRKDDTIKSISLVDIRKIDDSISMDIQIETRLNEVISRQL